jgi:hypothetical protein
MWHKNCSTFMLPMIDQTCLEEIPAQKGWDAWARFLQHWGVEEPAASLIEASGPMTIFLAQAIHFGSPFLQWVFPRQQWRSLAELLEDQQDSRIFVSYLRSKEIA